MKRYLTILLAFVLSSVVVNAQSDSTQVDAIEAVYAQDVETGIVDIIWQAGVETSEVFSIELARLDTTTYDAASFVQLNHYNSTFAVEGYPGYYQLYSDMLLQYGMNYEVIGDYGASQEIIDAWQSAWNASVNDDGLTLKSGVYVVFVEGLNMSFETTETYNFAMFTIEDATPIENVVSTSAPVKYMKDNALYLLKNGNVYNIYGTLVK